MTSALLVVALVYVDDSEWKRRSAWSKKPPCKVGVGRRWGHVCKWGWWRVERGECCEAACC